MIWSLSFCSGIFLIRKSCLWCLILTLGWTGDAHDDNYDDHDDDCGDDHWWYIWINAWSAQDCMWVRKPGWLDKWTSPACSRSGHLRFQTQAYSGDWLPSSHIIIIVMILSSSSSYYIRVCSPPWTMCGTSSRLQTVTTKSLGWTRLLKRFGTLSSKS